MASVVGPPTLLRHRRPPSRAPQRRLGLGYGGDYNPEQWPEDVWVEDARLMVEAGVTFVTVGVFSWALLEPRPGEHDLGWLDRVLDLMHEHGIAVDLATATASPPPWLTARHPEVLPVDRSGTRLSHGSRQSWCPSSPVYREHSLRLTRTLAERYADHPALVLWHVSNELGCHNAHCYCDVSAAAFRRWLADRYGDLEALNRAWGTAFWSQHYSAWDEVLPPRATTAQPNPTQWLDFRRFSSDELLGQHLAERAVLEEVSPGVPVTTNFMVTSHVDALDYHRWAPHQDVVSQDHYLDARIREPQRELALCSDWVRGLAGGPWVLMEHSTSAVNWQPRNLPKAPGQMRRNALQHVARGADSIGFFQWRASASGAEKYHSAMVPHAGTDTRVWREVTDLGALLGRLGDVAGTSTEASVALLIDHECWWAVQRESMPTSDLEYLDRARAFHEAFTALGVTCDVLHPSQPVDGYRLVVAPTLHLLRQEDADRLAAYVEGGGHLVVTYFSGTVDADDRIHLGGYPGPLREVLGVVVEELGPVPHDTVVRLETSDPLADVADPTCDTWVEDLRLRGAEAVASYADGPLPGVPAVTRHARGVGLAWYVATRTSPELTGSIARAAAAAAGVPVLDLPADVEVVRRSGPQGSFLFVLNHGQHDVEVAAVGEDLVTEQPCRGSVRVPGGGVAVVREEVEGRAGSATP
jgi:beta-galactosidase